MRPEARRRSRGHARAARLLFLLGGVAGCASAGGSPAQDVPTGPVAAFYTADQAARGQRTFSTVCSVCHGRTEFTGPIFGMTWMADPVGHLFEHISTKMPQNRPGSLSVQEYTDVVAYLLQLNGRTAGDRELPADPDAMAGLRW